MSFSASRTDLARRCLWWARETSPRTEKNSAAAIAGTERHAEIAEALTTGHADQPYGKAVLSAWQPKNALVEITFEFDCSTGQTAIIESVGRNYPRRPGCIYGTADAIDGAHVIDWKTGRKAPKAENNGQLLTLAVMARAAMTIKTKITGTIVRVSPDAVIFDDTSFDDLELDAHAEWLRKIPELIENSEPVPGVHCRKNFCPAYGVCPATSDGVQLVTLSPRKLARTACEIKNAEHAAWQYQMLRQAQATIDAAWTAITEYTQKNGDISLSTGQTWGPEIAKRTNFIATANAQRAITETVGPENAHAAYTIAITRTGIRAAAKKRAAETGESIAAVEREIVSALNSVGAVEITEHITFKEKQNDDR